MATPTFKEYRTLGTTTDGLTPEQMQERMLTLAAVLASGQNPDGTPFTLPTSSAVAADLSATGNIAGLTSVALALTGQSSVEFQLVTTAYTGTLVFEASYDSAATWVPLAVWPLGTTPVGNAITSLALAASTAEVVYQGSISGATNVRVRGSLFTGGTVAVTIRASENPALLLASALVNQGAAGAAWAQNLTQVAGAAIALGQAAMAASLPVTIASNQSAVPVSGTVSVTDNVDVDLALVGDAPIALGQTTKSASLPVTTASDQATVSDGTTSASVTASPDTGQAGLMVAGIRKEVSFTTAVAAAVGSTDVSNFPWVSVQVTSQGGSSTVTFQGSDDNATWVTLTTLLPSTPGAAAAVGSTTTTGVWFGPIPTRYFRLNVTGIVSGTTAGLLEFRSIPATPSTMAVNAVQSGTWTNGKTSDMPSVATAITAASGNQANASAAAALAATAGKTTFISGFEVTAAGATVGAAVTVTVVGTITGTLSYTFVVPTGATLGANPLIVEFNPPIPASNTNTGITVTLPALGAGNTNATAVAHGYQL